MKWEKLFQRRCMEVAPGYESLTKFVRTLPEEFTNDGIIIYMGRNELRVFDTPRGKVVVKSFCRPHLLNRIVYNFFRASKAARSYRYALMLRKLGIGTPAPVGYSSLSSWWLFGSSYYACLKSECFFTYRDLTRRTFDNQEEILRAIARTTARLHDNGLLHKDYSAGNILFYKKLNGEILVEIIDLNRMRFGKVSMEVGCQNFERLPGTDKMLRTLADEYARQRGFDPKVCFRLIRAAVTTSPYCVER